MSELTDQHLLRAWAERADEEAFRLLAGRYAGFVHGAALRRVSDAGLAEEITQDVFAALAREAWKLATHPTLAGWLHRAAMLTALDRVRRRARHERRVAQFHAMNDDTAARDPWGEIAPHLDAALDHLRTSEREVLMLHFAEQLTFPQIAARLGMNADAARMRTKRALEVLAGLLRKKSVVVPATVLGAGLGGTFAQAAPATLALTPAALAGAGKVGALTVVIHAFQTMKTVQLASFGALALALAVPLAAQQFAIASTGARIAALRQSRGAATSTATRSASGNSPASTTVAADRAIDFKQLGEDALDGDYFATRRIRETLERLDKNNLSGLIETVLHAGMMSAPREKLLQKLLAELGTRDPALFLEWSIKVLAGTVPVQAPRSDYASELRNDAEREFRAWMAAHPAQAAAWAEANAEAWKQFGGGSLRTLTVAGLLKADPPRAYAMLEKMSVAECMAVLFSARGEVNAEQSAALAKWAASSLPEVEKRRRIVRKALVFTLGTGPSGLNAIRPSLLGLRLNDDDLSWVAARLAVDSAGNIESDIAKVPKAEIAWIENLLPANHVVYAKGAIAHLYEPKTALTFLNAELDKAHDDDLIAGYVGSEDLRWHRDVMLNNDGGRHGDTAFRLATRVQEPERRVALLVQAWTDLRKDSADAAREILAIPELNPNDRAALEAQIAPLLEKKP